MKKITLFLLFTCTSCFLTAQSIAPDAGFGANGVQITGLNGMSGNAYGFDLASTHKGKMIIGGGFNQYITLDKYDHTGQLDPNFKAPLLESDGFEVGVTAQKDGKVLMVGENVLGLSSFVVRLDSLGNLDPAFGSNGIVQTDISYFMTHQILEQTDGKVLVFGDEWTNTSRFSALRLLSNGNVDASFGLNGKLTIDLPAFAHEVPFAAVEQPDHKLIFAGSIGYPDWKIMLVRVHPNGSLDATFGENGMVIDPILGNSNAYGLALQPDGKILIAGDTGPDFQAIVARYQPNGAHDLQFGTEGVQYLPELKEGVGIALTPKGKILSLNWSSNASLGNLALAQLMPDGQRDPEFGVNGIFRVVEPGMRPRALIVKDNQVTVSARKPTGTTLKRLYRFTLDLNVGTLNPDLPADPDLWVYPNPVLESFTLEFELNQTVPVSIELLDMQSKLVQKLLENQSFDPGKHALQLSCPRQLPAGNYVLNLKTAGKPLKSLQILKQ